jgi:hypothetical protein
MLVSFFVSFLFSFFERIFLVFFFSLEAQTPELLSKKDTFAGKGGGSKGDTPMPHQSLLYWAQDSS